MPVSKAWAVLLTATAVHFVRAENSESAGGEHIFSQLVAPNQVRSDALLEYSSTRTYRVSDPKGKVHAEEQGSMQFRAPDTKTFAVTSEQASAIIRHLALNPLIASEIQAAGGKDRHDSAITPAVYSLELIGDGDVRAHAEFVRDYEKVNGFWLPQRDETTVQVRIYGKKLLTIDRRDYTVKAKPAPCSLPNGRSRRANESGE